MRKKCHFIAYFGDFSHFFDVNPHFSLPLILSSSHPSLSCSAPPLPKSFVHCPGMPCRLSLSPSIPSKLNLDIELYRPLVSIKKNRRLVTSQRSHEVTIGLIVSLSFKIIRLSGVHLPATLNQERLSSEYQAAQHE